MDFTQKDCVFVYFVKFNSKLAPHPILKVGVTRNLANRVISLKNEYKITHDFTLLLALQTDSTDVEKQVLSSLRTKFAHLVLDLSIGGVRKTECFVFDEAFLPEIKKIKARYQQQVGRPAISCMPPVTNEDIIAALEKDAHFNFDEFLQSLLRLRRRLVVSKKVFTSTSYMWLEVRGAIDHTRFPFCELTERSYSMRELKLKYNIGAKDISCLLTYTFGHEEEVVKTSKEDIRVSSFHSLPMEVD